MPTFRPVIGDDDFDGIVCDLDDVSAGDGGEDVDKRPQEKEDTRTTRMVVAIFLMSIVTAVAVTGVYGLLTTDWLPLMSVWLVGAAPLGAIFARYVGKLDDAKIRFSR